MCRFVTMAAMVLVCASGAGASVVIDTVPVGDPGNAGEWSGESYGGYGPDAICGAVAYAYNIGKHEVTAGQYTAFLNAVAKTDTYELYSTLMWTSAYGCGIQRSGNSGAYAYSVTSDWANRPVSYVSFWDACRFANWLHNGQPTGSQAAGMTETGAYTLTTDGMTNNTVIRNGNWRWAVASEDEWYKAAYYKGGSTSAGYWDYPTSSDAAPGRDMVDASGNNANYYVGTGAYPIDSGKYTTVAGEFQNSQSPYGTFDQGGNVWEWNEAVVLSSSRCRRGGSFYYNDDYLHSANRIYNVPSLEYGSVGFRVSEVPEPASMMLLALGGMGLAARRRVLAR